MFVGTLLITLLFLGGWNGPVLPPFAWTMIKVVILTIFIIVIRATTVRLTIRKLLRIGYECYRSIYADKSAGYWYERGSEYEQGIYLFGWGERKIMGRMQSRHGPTYTGPFGILQNMNSSNCTCQGTLSWTSCSA